MTATARTTLTLATWALTLICFSVGTTPAPAAEAPPPPANAITITTTRGHELTIDPERFHVYDVPAARFEEITGIPYKYQTQPQPLGELKAQSPTEVGRVLTILIEWENHYANSFLHPAAAYDSLLYSDGIYPTGSVNDYYQEVSYGAFSFSGDVYGWATMLSFYDGDYDIDEIVSIVDPMVNFADYDGDGDGYVDALWLIHAGPGQEETHDPNDIWSHTYSGVHVPTGDGVVIDRWSMQPEEYANTDIVSIRVFCHEYGHILELPDLYDYDEKLNTNTYNTPNDANDHPLVDWDVMGYAGYNIMSYGTLSCPTHFSAWCRTFLGWATPEVPPCLDGSYQLYNVEEYGQQSIFKIPISDAGTEYYYLEYRNPHSGAKFDHLNSDFSAFFPWFTPGQDTLDAGLLITQIDETVSPNGGTPAQSNYAVRVVDAGYDPAHPWDGVSEFSEWWYPWEFRIGALYSPEDPGQTTLSPTTSPSSDGYDGPSGITITVVAQNDDYLTLDISRPYPPVIIPPPPIVVTEGEVAEFTVSATDDNCTTPALVTDGTLPPFALFSDQGDGTALLTLSPQFGDAGLYALPVVASDGVLEDNYELTITVNAGCLCPYQGDIDEDGFITSLDMSGLIDALFAGGPDPQDPNCLTYRFDLDCDDFTTALDLTVIIDYLFASGAGPCDACAL
jgi:M6 family metalloprotease-like protein